MRLAKALERAGHHPHVQWFEHRYELTPWRLKRVAAPVDADLVHAGSWQGFAFHREHLPLVVTEHQYVSHPAFAPYRSVAQAIYHRSFIEFCMRRSYRLADAVVAVSHHTADAMRNDLKRSVDVIPNWVDGETFDVVASNVNRDRKTPYRLLFVGNPSRWKGADVLPKLAERLGSSFEILCLGGLRRQFDASRLPRNMMLLPRTEPDRMPEVYRDADAVLIPTRYEAFGYVALEAMASGLPVLGFASSGTAEVTVHGETALLAPVDDIDALAAHARELADNPALAERLGGAGRLRATTLFNESSAVSAYVSLYRRVLTEHHEKERRT
jgi:glycosyltransferase involved in cell wall biosynthesis